VADGVSQGDHAVAEPVLLDELQLQPRTVLEEPVSATDDSGTDDHLDLVDQASLQCMRRELGSVDSEVVVGVGNEPSDRVRIELPLDSYPRAARLGESPGVNDLVGRLPLPRKVQHERPLIGERVRPFPYTIVSYILRP
jgi:hypothetical protein